MIFFAMPPFGWLHHCDKNRLKQKNAFEKQTPKQDHFSQNRTSRKTQKSVVINTPPTEKEWEAFYGRLMHLIARNRDNQDATGIFARRLLREMAHLWTFLEQEGVAPTNNHAERMIRFAVLWRKCSQGTSSDKGNRWVERILTLRQTCRLRTLKTYPILVDTVQRYFKGQEADLSWFTQG